MLDGLNAVISQWHRPIFDEKYAADQAITKATFLDTPNAAKLTVVFLPWHCPEWFEHKLLHNLLTAKTSAVLYRFNNAIIETDVLRVKSSFEYIALSIAQDIKALRAEKGYTYVTLLGISLGNVALAITAEEIDDFDDIIMLVPGDHLATGLWTGWRTRRLRHHYEKLGYKLEDLEQAWDLLGPASHLDVLREHPLDVILAHRTGLFLIAMAANWYRRCKKRTRTLPLPNGLLVIWRQPFLTR